MIADRLVNALKSYLEAGANDNLDDARVSVRDDDADLTYPALVIEEDGEPEQHELLRNEWTVPARITLRTIPEDTTEAAHQAMNVNLASLLGNIDALKASISQTLTCHDVWGGEGSTEQDGKYRETPFTIEARVNSVS